MTNDKDLDGILGEFELVATAAGFDGKQPVRLFRDAQISYDEKKTQEVEKLAATEEERLRQRIEKEAGILVYGKGLPKLETHAGKQLMIGDRSDYHKIADRNLTELALEYNTGLTGIWHEPFIGMGSFVDAELVRFIDNPTIYEYVNKKGIRRQAKLNEMVEDAADGPMSYVHYSIVPGIVDGFGRYFAVIWSIVASPELAVEVVSYARNNPNKAFDFFNTLVEAPQYTFHPSKRTGKLFIVNGNKIQPDADGIRKLDRLPRPDGNLCEVINYGVKK